MGEINTLVKQWIRTEGMHQVRKFGVNAVQDRALFSHSCSGDGLAASGEDWREGGDVWKF